MMVLDEYIRDLIRREDFDPLHEGFGPDAWADYNATICQITEAILDNNSDRLMELVREPFYAYVKSVAEYRGVDFDPEDEDEEQRNRFTKRSSLDPLL